MWGIPPGKFFPVYLAALVERRIHRPLPPKFAILPWRFGKLPGNSRTPWLGVMQSL